MHKILTLFLFLVCVTSGFSQNVTLKGKVLDTDDTALESATVYLTSAKDSTVIDYTITNKNGTWELKTRAISQPVFLKISYIGSNDFKERFETLTADKDFGDIKLDERSTEIGEVVIESEIPPIRIKQDTLEFNASSFKVRPDANVEALLKQLPGVEIDQEGKITVNGKEVNQILVNGKPFFDKDGKVALQNLPADIINKVQVSDTKTKQEELSGQKATSDNASINLTIDEEKNKGVMGRVMGGYGSDDRYESSAMVNYFKGPTKISLLASSNNINSTGFSMNEIFDSMGGGRNNNVWMSGDGSFGINGMRFGGSSGITTSNIVGLNYADEWAKGFDGTTNYFYTGANTKNRNRSNSINLVTEDPNNPGVDNSYNQRSESSTTNDQFAHNFNTEFNVKIDSTQTLYFAPKFTKANAKYSSNFSDYRDLISNSRALNDNEGSTYSESDNYTFASTLVWSKSLASKKGRSMNVSFENENRKDDGANFNKSVINQYTYTGDDQTTVTRNIDRVRYNRQATDQYKVGLEYIEPITDSLSLNVDLEYQLERMLEDRDGYDFDAGTGGYTLYNDALSNYLTSKVNSFTPGVGISLNKEKVWLNIDAGAKISTFDAASQYLGQNYSFNKNYILPNANANMSYRFTKTKNLWLGYYYNTSFPTPSQVLPVRDETNPLYITEGNSDLDPQRSHSINLSFRDYDYPTRSGYSVYLGGSFQDNQIVNKINISTSAAVTQTYANVSGTMNFWLGSRWDKTIKREANTFRFGGRLNGGYEYYKGITNDILYTSAEFSIQPKLTFTYEYGDLLVINPTYEYNYAITNYTNYGAGAASRFTHRLNLQTTSYWPKHVVFGNDFGYNYNSQGGAGFKKDFYLWNTSLGYNFLQDRMLFKVKVYDILNQNQGTSRTIGPMTITNQENIVLKRYVMFSLTFKLDKFGKKKEGGSDFWFF
ncbi:MAG: outer membrane beta-barrel protein [Bacteroidota bacterium]